MNHTAINQARRILSWAGVPDRDPAAQAVIAAGRAGDVGAALDALDWADLGALRYMAVELRERVEQRAEVADAA